MLMTSWLCGTPRILLLCALEPFLLARAAHAEASSSRLCELAQASADCLKFKTIQSEGKASPARGPQAGLNSKPCPADWLQSRKGDCLVETDAFGGTTAYVHPGGWVVDPRCFQDPRFGAAELMAALSLAQRKMSPTMPVEAGGCLSKFNPEWGREFSNFVWEKGMYLGCPAFDPSGSSCAEFQEEAGVRMVAGQRTRLRESSYSLLNLTNVAGCMGPESTGLAGIVFHEALHAAGADNYSTEKHNTNWRLEDHVFVSDRVYGMEALCFFGVDDPHHQLVHVMQCRQTVSYRAAAARYDLCRGFGAEFTDIPAKFMKH